jgi:hypothetical protein
MPIPESIHDYLRLYASEGERIVQSYPALQKATILYRPGSPPCCESRSLPRPSPRWVSRKSGRENVVLP